MKLTRKRERLIIRMAFRFILGNLSRRDVRRCDHYKQWLKLPLNYARVMELPLTDILLEAASGDRILDVSSPKLLAVYYGLMNSIELVAADLEDYFIHDFETFREQAGVAVETSVFDATDRIPFDDGSFDKVFSVSVLEHIPGVNDRTAFEEIMRVLPKGGFAVITLPVYPEYCEEWTSTLPYWQTQKGDDGRVFFQRRYDEQSLNDRLNWRGWGEVDFVLVAEKPIRAPEFGENGRLKHNSYLISERKLPKLIRGIGHRAKILPFMDYFAERSVSQSCHYLTRDWSDPNIRQIAFRVTKN